MPKLACHNPRHPSHNTHNTLIHRSISNSSSNNNNNNTTILSKQQRRQQQRRRQQQQQRVQQPTQIRLDNSAAFNKPHCLSGCLSDCLSDGLSDCPAAPFAPLLTNPCLKCLWFQPRLFHLLFALLWRADFARWTTVTIGKSMPPASTDVSAQGVGPVTAASKVCCPDLKPFHSHSLGLCPFCFFLSFVPLALPHTRQTTHTHTHTHTITAGRLLRVDRMRCVPACASVESALPVHAAGRHGHGMLKCWHWLIACAFQPFVIVNRLRSLSLSRLLSTSLSTSRPLDLSLAPL